MTTIYPCLPDLDDDAIGVDAPRDPETDAERDERQMAADVDMAMSAVLTASAYLRQVAEHPHWRGQWTRYHIALTLLDAIREALTAPAA